MSTVPCKTCGEPTRMTSTKLCDSCWEVERRLDDYLRRGGEKARTFVFEALKDTIDTAVSVEGAPV